MAKEPIAEPTKPDPVAADPPVALPVPLPEPAKSAEPPLVEPEPAFSLKDAAKAHGIDPSAHESDQSLAEAMFSTLDGFQQNEPFVKIGQQFAPYADKLSEFQAWQTEQAKVAKPAPEEKKPSFEWDSPEYDPRWEGMVERDERGYFKAPDGLPSLAPVAEKMNRYREFQTDALTKFLSNPQELIHAATAEQLAEMEARIVEANQQGIKEAIAKQQSDAELNAYVREQEKDLFLYDAGGQARFNADGSQMLSPKGHAMAQYASEAERLGITAPIDMKNYINMGMERDELRGKFTTSPTTPSSPATSTTPAVPVKKKRFLDRVRGNSRGGTIPDPTAPEGSQQQNPDASMQEITQRIAREQGVTLP